MIGLDLFLSFGYLFPWFLFILSSPFLPCLVYLFLVYYVILLLVYVTILKLFTLGLSRDSVVQRNLQVNANLILKKDNFVPQWLHLKFSLLETQEYNSNFIISRLSLFLPVD